MTRDGTIIHICFVLGLSRITREGTIIIPYSFVFEVDCYITLTISYAFKVYVALRQHISYASEVYTTSIVTSLPKACKLGPSPYSLSLCHTFHILIIVVKAQPTIGYYLGLVL
jgi:hypothetical protein